MGLAQNGTTIVTHPYFKGAEFGTISKFETPEVKCDIDIRWLEMYVEYVVPSHLPLKSTILSVVRTKKSVVIVHMWAWWACNVCWWSSTCMGRVNMEGQIQVKSAGQATVWSRDRVFTLQTKCPQAMQLANCRNLGVASPQCSAIHWNYLLDVALSKLSVGRTNDTLNDDRQVSTFHALDLMTHVSCQHLHNVMPSICTPWRCFQHVSISLGGFPSGGTSKSPIVVVDFSWNHPAIGDTPFGFYIVGLMLPMHQNILVKPQSPRLVPSLHGCYCALHRSHWLRLRDAFRGWKCGK